MNWSTLADEVTIGKTVAALIAHGIDAEVVSTRDEARVKVLSLVPPGAQVFTMTSITLEQIGVLPQINESGKYQSVRTQLLSMNRDTQGGEMRKLGAGPDWAVGSVHAVTVDGVVMIASNTGSQLGAYAGSAGSVIWVVGTQKIVRSPEDGLKRIYEYCLPLESKRMGEKLGRPFQSSVSKILTVYKEVRPHRVTLLFVKENLGF